MRKRFLAFDVETPNHCNNRICSMGISIVDEFNKIESSEYLINPECNFDKFNISIHGITDSTVQNAPNFVSIWQEISHLFENNIVVAHNAQFDLCVLKKTLQAYGLNLPSIQYLCTLQIAQSAIDDTTDYRLPTLCKKYNIPLMKHHSACCDSEACAKLLLSMESDGIDVLDFTREYDMTFSAKNNTQHHAYHISDTTRSLTELNNLLKEISIDGILTTEEIDRLSKWMEINSALRGNFPYDRIYNKLTLCLEDGIIDKNEEQELLNLFNTSNLPIKSKCNTCNSIIIKGKKICLSGEFEHGSKESISEHLISFGAIMQNSVTQKTDIVLVGDKGSSSWNMGNYGSKIKKALELQEKGYPILILKEEDFYNLKLEYEDSYSETNTDEPSDIETLLYESIKEEITDTEKTRYLNVSTNKDTTISIRAKSFLVAKIKLNGKKKYIDINKKHICYFEDVSYEIISNTQGEFIRINIDSLDDVIKLKKQLSICYILVLSELGGESFGCCSRYMECSDAKKCLNPDIMMSFACEYKKNLESGKIFYGKNRNI